MRSPPPAPQTTSSQGTAIDGCAASPSTRRIKRFTAGCANSPSPRTASTRSTSPDGAAPHAHPRTLTPGAGQLTIGQHFLIFAITSFDPDSYIAGLSRPQFDRAYGRIAVSYSLTPLDHHTTRLRANACVEHSGTGIGIRIRIRHLALAAGDKIMAGRQLRTLKARAESAEAMGELD